MLPLREAAQVTASGEEVKNPKVPYQVIFTPEPAVTAAYKPVRIVLRVFANNFISPHLKKLDSMHVT